MKRLILTVATTACLTLPLALLNGCAPPRPASNPLDVALKCPGSGYRVNIRRDMSAITIFDKVSPLYSATAKDSVWNYGEDMGAYRQMVSAQLNRQNHSYSIRIADGASFICVAPINSDLPSVLVNDYFSPAAMKDNERTMQREKEKNKNLVKDNEALSRAKKQCSIYASDIAARTGMKNVLVMSASPINHLVACIIMGRNAVYDTPKTLRIMGNGDNYEYEIIN